MKQSIIIILLLINQLGFASNPKISFFNELESKELKILFSDSTLIPSLKKMNAEIRMGILDLTPDRAEIIRRLNENGITVIAWLLLPKEEGYWFHSGNWQRASERYDEIKNWAKENQLIFNGIGIDIEIDYQDAELYKNHKFKFLKKVVGRLYNKEDYEYSKNMYNNLIERIRTDGYSIESYYIPFVKDETENGRTALQQATGIMDLTTDKDIPMLYSSFIGNPYGLLKVAAIDKNLKYVAIGSTGGGIDPTLPSMTWEDLSHDLRLVSKTVEEIHIFCLEASVEKGFIPKLIDFDFDAQVTAQPEQEVKIKSLSKKIMLLSKILSYPTLTIVLIILVIVFTMWLLYFLIKKVLFK